MVGLRVLAGFRFRRVEGNEQTAALELRRRVYAADWPSVSATEVIDELDARAYHFIAEDAAGVTIAAFRMIGPSGRPFDMEHFVAIENFLQSDRVPAEVGRLCIRHENRSIRSDAFVLLGLLKLAYDFARGLGVTDLLLKAAPRLIKVYGAAGFRPVGVVIRHPSYGEEHVMRLDLLALESQPAAFGISKYLVDAKPGGIVR